MRPELQIDGTWRVIVDRDWPGFAGHFPGNAILPAAVVVDWALAVIAQPATLVRAKFTAPLRPGAVVILARSGLRVEVVCGSMAVATLQFAAV